MCGGWWPWIDYELAIAEEWKRFEAFRAAFPGYDGCRGFPSVESARECGEAFAKSENAGVEVEVRQ